MGAEVIRLYEEKVEEKKPTAVVVNIPKYRNGTKILKNTFNDHKRGGKSYPLKTEQEIHDVIAYYDNEFKNASNEKNKKLAARNVMLETIGFNIGIRGSDLIGLQWKQIFDNKGNFIEDDDEEEIIEHKTGKIKGLILNEACKNAINEYIKNTGNKTNPDGYLFFNGRGGHINVQSCSNIIKEAADSCGIRRRIASHTLRKTFALFQIKAHNNDSMFINELQRLLNHSTQDITLRYCGLSNDRLKQYHHDVNLGMTCNIKYINNNLIVDQEKVIISKSELIYVIQKALENNENDYLLEDIINNIGLKELIK